MHVPSLLPSRHKLPLSGRKFLSRVLGQGASARRSSLRRIHHDGLVAGGEAISALGDTRVYIEKVSREYLSGDSR